MSFSHLPAAAFHARYLANAGCKAVLGAKLRVSPFSGSSGYRIGRGSTSSITAGRVIPRNIREDYQRQRQAC